MGLALRHNWSQECLKNQIELLDLHFPGPIFNSKYKFLKAFPECDFERHFYCIDCNILLELTADGLSCTSCKKNFDHKKLQCEGQYFLYLPLKKQIENLLNTEISLELRKETHYSDIINSDVYKFLTNSKVIDINNISIQFNVDGVNYFKSSKRSLWPIMVQINELPYRLRKNNILICGLWEGTSKPKMNLYLQPFIEE